MTRKKCCKCGRHRLVKFFHNDRRRKDGKTPDCVDCRRAYQRAHYAKPENRLKRKKYAAKWYRENREAVKKRTDEYRRKNLAKYAAWMKRYRQEHPEYVERCRLKSREYYYANREAS